MATFFDLARGLLLRARNAALILGLAVLAVQESHAAPNKSGVGPGAVSLPSGPGSIEGMGDSFEVQLNTGTASFGFSAVLPPGRAGLIPSAHVGYDTGAGNGLAGIGWNFGFLSIRRQQDKGFPQFNDGDTFVLGGEELVPLSNAQQDWRCKNERSFQRVRQIPAESAWEVTDPNGTRHILGQYRGLGNRFSAVQNPSATQGTAFDQTYMWCEDTTIDVHGNRIEYEYQAGQGILYPSRITYAHWPDPNLAGRTNYHEVTFIYEGRPDVFEDFRATFPMVTDLRLKRIEVASFYDGTRHLVRTYGLDYAYRPEDLMPFPEDGVADLGVSLLKRVTQYGSDGNTNNYLPPLLLKYSDLNLTKSRLQTIEPPDTALNEVHGNVQLIDIDGDGLPDLFQTTDFDQRFQLNRGELPPAGGGDPILQFAPISVQPRATDMVLQDPEAALADLNGDGLADYVHFTDGNFGTRELHVFKNASSLEHTDATPAGFSLQEEVQFDIPPGVSLTNAAVKQMDVNSDKRTDFVVSEPGFFGQFRFIYRDQYDTWQEIVTPYPSDMPGALTFAWNGNDGGDQIVYLADMNGDRMPDVVLVQVVGQDLAVTYWPYTGLATFGSAHTMTVAAPDALSFETADLRDVLVQDFTGDGLADLLMLDGSGDPSRLVFRANVAGAAWAPPYERDDLPHYRPRDPSNPTTFRTADLNGNGSTDLIWINPGSSPGWQWLDLQPQGKPNLLVGMDNNLGKVTAITYGNITEDVIRAREKGYPWQTKVPFPMQVIRRLRVTAGYDLDGVSDVGRSTTTDQYVSDFAYRDGYYDAYEKQFRGFAFAQKTDYGDDALLDTNLVTMGVSPGWDRGKTPTGQVQDPTLIARLHYHTGAPDGVDNDEYPPGFNGPRFVDEVTPLGGHEEEPLKGMLMWQEELDPWAIYDPSGAADFDRGCWLAVVSTNAADQRRMTPDDYVYQRTTSDYIIRRLYRSDFPLAFTALIDGAQQSVTNVLTPPGRFDAGPAPVTVLPQSGLTVSYAFESQRTTLVPEANGILSDALNYPRRPPVTTLSTFDHDDYGNEIRNSSLGIVSTNDLGDHRIVTTKIALGGDALTRWMIRLTAETECTDVNGNFVSRRRDFYDGDPYTGLALGQVGARGLMHRMEGFINGETLPPELTQRSDRPGDPRLAAGRTVNVQRKRYDTSGNLVEVLDPLAVLPALTNGHVHQVKMDPRFNLYPIEERISPGNGNPDLAFQVDYDPGIGAVTSAVDYNGYSDTFLYDNFSRLVASVTPGDSVALPTITYEYIPADPTRGRVYRYDMAGNLTLGVESSAGSRIVSRQRLVSGTTNVYVSVKYLDGLARPIATVGEGDSPGHWVVLSAVGMSRRGRRVEDWLPFDLQYGASHEDIPPFLSIMTTASRPPPTDVAGRAIVSSSSFNDPSGRVLRKVAAPDAETGGVRRFSEVWHLPLETQVYDENATAPGSPTAGVSHITHLDGLGRMISTVETTRLNDNGAMTGQLQSWTTLYKYDLNENPIEIVDSQGNVKWFRYDGLSRKLFVEEVDRGPTTFTYDDASNQIDVEDAKGQHIATTHDGLNRILTTDYLDAQSGEFSYGRHPTVSYHYDFPHAAMPAGDGGVFRATNTVAQLAWVEDTTGESHFTFDSRGRIVEVLKRVFDWESAPGADGTLPLIPFRTTQTYDNFNRVTERTFPDNDAIRQEHGSRNLPKRIYGDLLGDIVNFTGHFPNGKLSGMVTGDGVVTAMEQDPRLRLTRLQARQTRGGTNVLTDFGYSYDGLSSVLRIDDLRPSEFHAAGDPQRNTQLFQYDDLHRLIGVRYSFGLSGDTNRDDGEVHYRYDRIGNLLSQSSTIVQQEAGLTVTQLGDMAYGGKAGRYNRIGKGAEPGPHALTSDPARNDTLGYDGNGNLSTQSGQKYTWDFADKLVKAETADSIAESRYDYTGRRVLHKVTSRATGESVVTFYPMEEFEIRPHDEPVKYVCAGKTKIARVTAMLSHRPRVQRLRIRPGWNLAATTVTATNLAGQLSGVAQGPGSILRYVADTKTYLEVGPGETTPSGTVLWIYSGASQVASIVGSYAEPAPFTTATGGFVGNASALPWTPLTPILLGFTNASVWQFGENEQLWVAPPVVSTNGGAGQWPEIVPPGGAFFASTGSPLTFTWPKDSRAILYYHADHLGSSSILTDRDGNVLEESTYYAFGQTRTERSTDGKKEPYGFAQKEHDPETGLNYFDARYQHPVYGRFISVDPKLALNPSAQLCGPQGLNFYAYCANNPQAFTDPSGENFLGDFVDDVKASVRDIKEQAKEFGREVVAASSTEAHGRGRVQLMVGVWCGDKDYVSGFVEDQHNYDLNGLGGGSSEHKVVAGAIALDGRFVYAKQIWGNGPETFGPQDTLAKGNGTFATESKAKYAANYVDKEDGKKKFGYSGGTTHDTVTGNGTAATGIKGEGGSKFKRGIDYKILGTNPGISRSGRMEVDTGIGITGGGEFSKSVGNFELSGKLNGTISIKVIKVEGVLSIVVTGTGYGELQGLIKIPQTGNLVQIPLRLSLEGTAQAVYKLDFDKVSKLKGK